MKIQNQTIEIVENEFNEQGLLVKQTITKTEYVDF
jgi:hypothetical protein